MYIYTPAVRSIYTLIIIKHHITGKDRCNCNSHMYICLNTIQNLSGIIFLGLIKFGGSETDKRCCNFKTIIYIYILFLPCSSLLPVSISTSPVSDTGTSDSETERARVAA